MIVISIADIPIGIENRHKFIVALSKDYLTDSEPVFTVSASDEEIAREREMSDDEFSDGYLESIVVFRKIAERLPEFDAVVFHGAVLSMGGKAYAFTAKSGVGKTTHTRLWISEFYDSVHYINGDKPVIRLIDGVPYAFGTPWRGKEGYGRRESAPLSAIALLERAESNSAVAVPYGEGTVRLMKQIYIPKNPVCASLAMRVADKILTAVRFIELKCNMDKEAAHVAYRAMIEK